MNSKQEYIESLIRISRHYCLDNWEHWSHKYQNERSDGSNYTDKDYNIFPRYNCLAAILDEIERIIDDEFESIKTCKETLIFIGENAESDFTINKNNEIEKRAISDERNKFTNFISEISEVQLIEVPSLFYRKVLNSNESTLTRNKLLKNWNFDGSYWEPLKKCSPKPFIFFDIDNLTKSDFNEISKIIIDNSEPKMYAISEDGKDLLVESNYFEAEDVYEILYTDNTFEWLFYGSHEDTIAISGEKQIEQIRKYFSDRKELINKW